MKFMVTIKDRLISYRSKVFEAVSDEQAKEMAIADESWTELDGWEDDGEQAGGPEIVDVIVVSPY